MHMQISMNVKMILVIQMQSVTTLMEALIAPALTTFKVMDLTALVDVSMDFSFQHMMHLNAVGHEKINDLMMLS